MSVKISVFLVVVVTLFVANTSFANDLFAEQSAYGRGDYPAEVTTGDFNGDGFADVAAGGYNSNTIAVFLAKGDGTFHSMVSYGIGGNVYCTPPPYAITSGDFNGDGNLDLATSNMCNSMSVLLGKGDGTFQLSGYYWGWESVAPWAITAGDFNGDEKIDIATGSYIYLGNGDGTFWKLYYWPGNEPYSLATGDFNNDGKLDLAAAGYSRASTILLGNGDGTFQEPLFYEAGSASMSVTTGDFNGDGKADLATANRYNSISVLLGTGNGSFQPRVDYEAGEDPWSITRGDFNSDGKGDLATANAGGGVSIFLGNGDGTFQQMDNYPGRDSVSISAGDFNGDGWMDLATANFWNRSISIALNVYDIPKGSVTINGDAGSTCFKEVTLTLSARDNSGVVSQMRFSNDGVNWSEWEAYLTSKSWILSSGYGTKTVYVQFKDGAGNISSSYSDTMYLYPTTPGEVAAVVTDMLTWGVITNNGYANALTSTLNNAQTNMEIDPVSTRNMLEATINKLEAQSDKKINQDAAERLIEYLNCSISNL